MRVLAVANWNPATTRSAWPSERLRALAAAGVEVDLLARDCVRDRREYFGLWRDLNRRLATGRYDLVAPLYGSFLGLLCTLQRRVPCAISFAGSDLNGPPRLVSLRSLSRPASQLSAALAAGVSVHSARMRRALWWPPARQRAHVLFDGVDVERFVPRGRTQARRHRGVRTDGIRILFVAVNPERRPTKRLPLAQAAVARLSGARLEVASAVPFDEMPWVYASADALLLTSHAEGSPNCVKEALACGVPVVSTDVGDVREVLDGLPPCAVVDPDPDRIAAALGAIVADGRGCPGGPARIAERYSQPAAAQRFVRFFDDALDVRPPRQ
ncbi:MAG: glycosyl transferase [Myxococcales bacterium]|nr:glycosyl transferase [Myxococcales bacterium]